MNFMQEEKEFGKGITHIEDLKPMQLLALLKQFQIGKNFTVTEKMDGFFMTFGYDDSGFFAGTKNTTWRSAAEFPDLYFLSGLKNYIQRLQTLNVPISIQTAFKLPSPPTNVRITGESIPSYDHNIVLYDPNIIGDGAFVIYQITFDGKQITDPKLIARWISVAQKSTTIKFFNNPQVAWKFKTPQKIVVDLEKLITKHGNVLAMPAKTQEDKILKQALLDKAKQVGMLVKQKILKDPYKPFFGGDYEGYVVHMPDGSMVKVIDKDKFTKSKEANWHFIDNMQRAEKDFKKNTKTSPNELPNHVSSFEKTIVGIKSDFLKNADKYITIPKKKQDTIEELKLYARKIAKLKELISKGIGFQEIIDMYNKRQINEQTFVREGGHAFGNKVNSVVPKQFLDPTIKAALKSIGLESIPYKVVGNTSKQYLGDIDVALNSSDLVDTYKLNVSSVESFWSSLNNKLSEYNVPYTINKGFKQFHIMTSVVDSNGNEQLAIDASGNQSDSIEIAKVQIDFFVGKISWMTDIMSGAPASSKYKAYYRNILLRSIVSKIKNPSNPNERYVIDFKSGIDLVKFEMLPPTGLQKKERENVLSRGVHIADANTLAQWLFGKQYSWKDLESFEQLLKLLNSSSFRFPEARNEILEKFKKELVSDKKEVPSELMSEQQVTPTGKTIGLFLGGFKPFHRGHMAGVELAASQCDIVYVIASIKNRDKRGFSLTGETAREFWEKFVLPILPKNVSVIFSDKPYNQLLTILHEQIEPTTDSVIIYGDKEDLLANFGGPTYKKLQKFIPNMISQNRISVAQVPRITSGTKVREALVNRDLKTFKENMPKQLQGKAREIMNFFLQRMGIAR